MISRATQQRIICGRSAWKGAILACAVCTLVSCAGAPRGDRTTTPYTTLFKTGQYGDALEQASKVAGSTTGAPHDEAALIAGLSAQALGRNAEASHWLRPISSSNDRNIAGRANAALGLTCQDRGEHEEAAKLLTIAGEKLQGDESARAFLYAGDSYRALGNADKAAEAYQTAQQRVVADDELRVMIGDHIRGGGTTIVRTNGATPSRVSSVQPYTVQVGAYKQLTTAQQQAQRVADRAQVRIVPILRGNERLYAVRVGRFSSRDAAEQVKQVIGGTATVTAASGE